MSTYQPPDGGTAINSVILVGANNQPASLGGGGGGATAAVLDCTLVRVNAPASTTIPAGATEISIANVGTAAITVQGAVVNPLESVEYRCPDTTSTLGTITYNGVAGSIALVSVMRKEV